MTRRLRVLLPFCILLVVVVPGDASAQTRADSAAVLLETATRFEAMGRLDVADALYEHILERFGDTPAAAEVRRIRTAMPADRAARSGRVELQVWGTLYGLWLGAAVPMMAGADDPAAYGIGLLLGGPVGFFGSRAYARSRRVSEGQARAITFGGTWGTWQGFGWAEVFDIGTGNESTDEYAAAMVAGGLAGIATGALIARKPISAGTASAVNFGALWGSWFGVAGGVLADLEDDDLLASALVGGNAGLITAAVVAPRLQISRNRARLASIAGVLGGVAGAGVSLIVQPDDDKVAIFFPLAGSVVGLAIGMTTTRDYDRSAPQGDPGGAGALLEWGDGMPSFDLPVPELRLTRTPERPGSGWTPALRVRLLHARF